MDQHWQLFAVTRKAVLRRSRRNGGGRGEVRGRRKVGEEMEEAREVKRGRR